ncbi:cytochrome c biogenesis protein CcmG, thiol:disulfide interchange protein DsbE [Loktanella fryxellensis]|uniref:Cytochrome c biogenesis protein CcmG, thiol:disulfide interchange protein DsbE n=1 Tax=Loktanella fryxellensis TaxID=245187 RepID=A0A1H8BFX2_9RHOB|nr:DsbE family thiol:disulfide interchange protein [Loktanella fryxellensis]SEM81369.1 cytochrome c biogenesis protein CcmG, thiol:disulfide interchange protein DsbE [Loktanella fryxellensis]
MAKLSPLMIVPPVIFAALAGLFWGGLMRDNAGELPSQFVGQPAPPLPTEAVAGTALLTAADLAAGEVTIVNFWASWCPPCRAEHPTLQALADQGYRVAGINFRDQADDAAAYLADEGDPFFATGFDLRGRSAIDWGVSAPPETFVIAADGTVVGRFTGPLVGSDVEQRFMPMLDAALAAD